MQLNIVNSTSTFDLPDEKQVESEFKEVRNLDLVKERIQEIIQVLGDFKNRRQEGKKRVEYLKIFQQDLCSYYGYNDFLMEKFMELFPNGSEVGFFDDLQNKMFSFSYYNFSTPTSNPDR